MIEDKLRHTIRHLGLDIVNRVNDHQPLNSLEEDILSRLVRLDDCRLVISGYHRRMEHVADENKLVRPYEDGQYIVVLNLLDGEENYSRGSNVYGLSLSVTSINTGGHFAVVYDGLIGQVVEFSETTRYPETKDIVIHSQQSKPSSVADREQRGVFAFGRMFGVGQKALKELGKVSIRSLGSTTVSILEVMRGHLDVYVNITKIWNVWWASWLPNCRFQLEDLSNGRKIQEQIPDIISAPERTLAIICYRDDSIKRRFSASLRDFSKHILSEE